MNETHWLIPGRFGVMTGNITQKSVDAGVTEAGNLPARYVIRTVGPVWHCGRRNEADLLSSAYAESLKRAEELERDFVAIPAISTGVYGHPRKRAAEIACRTISA